MTISQVISTPSDPFFLHTSTRFTSTDGALSLRLDGQPLATIDGFVSVGNLYETVSIPVTDTTLLGRQTLLEITYDGPTGS